MQTELPVTISPSRAQQAERCQRRHSVANVLGMEPIDAPTHHRDFGTAIHEAAAAWWEEGSEQPAVEALERSWEPSIEATSDLTLELAKFMVRYYCADANLAGKHWATDAAWTVEAVEERIELELSEDVVLSFRLDRLARCADTDPPAWVVVDTKTSSRFGRYWTRERWLTNLQQKLYHKAVEEHYGIELDGHYIEGVLKSAPSEIRYVALDWPKAVLAEALEHARRLAMRDAELVRKAEGSASALVELVARETATNGDDCFAFGRQCECFELCHETPPNQRIALIASDFEEVEQEWLA